MKQIKQVHNNLLGYSRVVLEVDHNKAKTPSNQDVLNKVAQELKVNPELIKVKHIYSHYGLSKSRVIANVYNNIEMFKRLEEIKKKPKKEKKAKKALEKKE